MRRFFARNFLFVFILNIVVKPVWIFLIDLTVQNKVGHEAYGTYQPLLNLAVIFQILLDFGINNYNSRVLSHFPGKVKRLFPVMLTARIFLSTAYLILVSAIGIMLGYSGKELLLLQGLLLVQVLGSVILFFRSTAAGLHRFKWDGVLSISDRVLMIFICGALLIIPAVSSNFRIEWYVGALLASSVITVVLGYFVMRHVAKVSLRLSFQKTRVLNIMYRSLPFATVILLMGIYTRVDFIMIERLGGSAGKEQAGIYATAYRLLDMGNMLGLMFAAMLLPVFAKMLRHQQNITPIIRLCTNVLIPFSLIAVALGIFYPSEIMNLLYRDTTAESTTVFTLLMISLPAFSLSNIYSTVLTAASKLQRMIGIAAIGVLLNLTLNFWLIPNHFAVGAAVAACATQWLVALLFLRNAKRLVPFSAPLKWVLTFGFYFLILLLAGYCLQFLPLFWMVRCAMLLAVAAMLMFAFRFIAVRELMALISKK